MASVRQNSSILGSRLAEDWPEGRTMTFVMMSWEQYPIAHLLPKVRENYIHNMLDSGFRGMFALVE